MFLTRTRSFHHDIIMQITDEAIILSCERFGESNYLLSAFTRHHGRIGGLVRKPGAAMLGVYQTGNTVHLHWSARLPDQLGTIRAEMAKPVAAQFMHRPEILLAIQSACGWCHMALPDRQPYGDLYYGLNRLWMHFTYPGWMMAYALWEIELLQHLGFGLDLSACAVTGANDNLAYVSPKTGRAVSRDAATPWIDRLLPLPPFVHQFYANGNLPSAENDNTPVEDILSGLRLSGYFLDHHILKNRRKSAPAARQLLIRRLITANDERLLTTN